MSDRATFLQARIEEDARKAKRALSQAEARLKILDVCVAIQNGELDPGKLPVDDIMASLAMDYEDHPDFREEWTA